MNEQETLRPPQGGSVIAVVHQCQYQIAMSDLVIVRWCTQCGASDKLERYSTHGPFPGKWTRIQESYTY